MTLQQLPLAVQLPANETFTTWVSGANAEAQNALTATITCVTKSNFLTYLWGPSGVGKSHLLHAVSAAHEAVMYLPLRDIENEVDAGILEGLEQYQWLCLDDIDAVTADADWAYGLFKLLNRVHDQQCSRVVVTAQHPPVMLEAAYADVLSRLQWGTTLQLKSLSDEQKMQALQLRAEAIGLTLREDAAQFMVQRLGRDMRTLMDCLLRLDQASIAAQRRLTIPFIKAVLDV